MARIETSAQTVSLPRVGLLQRPGEDVQAQRDEQHQERVGARLLRVPDEEGVERDQCRRHHAGPTRRQLPSCQERDRNGERSEHRRQEAEVGRVRSEAEGLGPEPFEHVVEGRRALQLRDCGDGSSDRRVQHARGGDRLVVIQALHPKRRESHARRDCGDHHERDDVSVLGEQMADPSELDCGRQLGSGGGFGVRAVEGHRFHRAYPAISNLRPVISTGTKRRRARRRGADGGPVG